MGEAPNFAIRSKKKGVSKEKPKKEPVNSDEQQATQLPTPTGYKLLIGLPEIEETTEGGIVKSSETMRMEQIGSVVGFVVDMGPDAYSDKKRFPNGPYCKKGDFIIMRSYSGTRLNIHGTEWRLINDDSVEAVVQDPRGIAKV